MKVWALTRGLAILEPHIQELADRHQSRITVLARLSSVQGLNDLSPDVFRRPAVERLTASFRRRHHSGPATVGSADADHWNFAGGDQSVGLSSAYPKSRSHFKAAQQKGPSRLLYR